MLSVLTCHACPVRATNYYKLVSCLLGATDIPVYFFGLYLFLSPNGLIHCLQIFVPKLFLKMPICNDVNRNTNITFDCLFFMFCKQSLMPEFLLSVDSCKNWHFQKQFGYKNMQAMDQAIWRQKQIEAKKVDWNVYWSKF